MNREALRVLVVDDDEQEFIIFGKHLSKIKTARYRLDWISSFDEALQALEAAIHDVCVVDYHLGADRGTELIRRAVEKGCKAPIILLTGHGSFAVDVEAMNCGAADFLAKDQLDGPLLERSIRYAIERSKTLNALRESEARYSLAVAAGKVGVWELNLASGTLHIASNMKELLGYAEEEMGIHVNDWRAHIHPEDRKSVVAALEAATAGETPEFWCEYRIQDKSGAMHWFLSRGTVIRGEAGKALRMTGTDTDITERKNAEQQTRILNAELEQRVKERTAELREAKESLETTQRQLSEALEAMDEGFALFDADERLVLNNTKYVELFEQYAELIVPGVKFEHLLREGVKRKVFSARQGADDTWINERLAYFRNPKGSLVVQLADGRWIEIEENRTRDGGTVGIRKDITERKLTEEAIRSNQQLLQAVFDSFPHHLYVKDREGTYVMMNEAVAKGAGWTLEEGVGKNTRDLTHLSEDTKRDFLAEDNHVMATGEALEINRKTIRLADGTEQYRRVIKKPLRDETGAVTGVVGINEDITERIRAVERLRDSERLLQTVFDTIPIAVYVKDLEGKFIMANQALSSYLGYDHDALLFRRFRDVGVGTEEEVRKAEETDRQVIEEGKTIHIPEETLTYPNGDVRWRHTLKAPLHDELGKIVGLVGVQEDITERKRTEEKVRSSERLLRGIIDSLPYWLAVRDTEGRYQLVNSAMAEAHGWTVEQYVNRRFEDTPKLITDDGLERMIPVDRKVIKSGKRAEVPEYEVILPNGERRIRRLAKFPLFDAGDKIIGVVGWSEDITGRKKTEEQMKRQQLQLIHADKMASLGVLVAGVAHEINNPNTSIMLNVPLLQRIWDEAVPILEEYASRKGQFYLANIPFERAREEIPRLLAGIAGGSERVKQIVENLRNFGRLNESRELYEININEVVEYAVDLLESQIGKYTDCFTVQYGNNIPRFHGDFQEIEQVVINLINNACQSIPERQRGVSVSTKYNNGHVIVTVTDEGVGIPEENLNRIMDPFFTTKADDGGTGLGLSVSFGIVKEHGGMLEFSSHLGKGTKATILLPAVAN
ncbi:MAG: PAS domain S-box protein [SAR324 cluster bacterium]|nr:PAS domain S-box protein [SAR324 cluster bacterium]